MIQVVWTLPVPSTALLHDCVFEKLPGRACSLRCDYEDEDDNIVSLKLLFDGVEAFKCTYQGACTPEMISSAYDNVVDMDRSEWLSAVAGQLVNSGAQDVGQLKHFAIYLDDGPCYEFICRTFRVEQSNQS